MSGLFTLKTKFLFLIGVFVSAVFLSGCQQHSLVDGNFVSKSGVSIDSIFPHDVFLFAKIGTNNKEQLENLKRLNSYFPNDYLVFLVELLNKEISDNFLLLKEWGVNYKQDLLPLFNNETELYFGLAYGPDKNLSDLHAIAALTLADKAGFDKLFNEKLQNGSLHQKDYLQKKNYLGIDYYNLTIPNANSDFNSVFIARLEDVVVLSNKENSLKDAIDFEINKGKTKSNSLVYNPLYKRSTENYKPSFFFVYGDFGVLMNLAQVSKMEKSTQTYGLNYNEIVDTIASQTLAVRAENDGLRLSTAVFAKDGKDLREQSFEMKESYLFGTLSAIQPLFYAENYNLAGSYKKFVEITSHDEDLRNKLNEFENSFKSVGLDFKNDVLSFLDRGYAFSIEDNDSVIPSIGFYLDVAGNVSGAEKVFLVVHDFVGNLWEMVKAEHSEIAMLLHHEEVTQNRLWRFRLNLDSLLAGLDDSVKSKKLSGQKIELYYGLLDKNIGTIALKPELNKSFDTMPSIGKSEEFRESLKRLNGAKYAITYFSPTQVLVYLDRVMDLMKSDLPPLSIVQYEMIKSYVRPLKSIVSGSHEITKEHAFGETFLHIAQ